MRLSARSYHTSCVVMVSSLVRFSGSPTYRVPVAGGTPIPATTIDRSRQETSLDRQL